jgi:hypothetical protein
MNPIIISGLPEHIILRLLTHVEDEAKPVYLNISTVMIFPSEHKVTRIVFDGYDYLNYDTDMNISEILYMLSGA